MLVSALYKLVQSVHSGNQPKRRSGGKWSAFRPGLEILEERLPPGDILFGMVLGSSWSAPAGIDLEADALIKELTFPSRRSPHLPAAMFEWGDLGSSAISLTG